MFPGVHPGGPETSRNPSDVPGRGLWLARRLRLPPPPLRPPDSLPHSGACPALPPSTVVHSSGDSSGSGGGGSGGGLEQRSLQASGAGAVGGSGSVLGTCAEPEKQDRVGWCQPL